MSLDIQAVHPDDAQREVMRSRALELRAKGYSYRRMAPELGISHQMAYFHVKAAFEELHAQGIADAHEVRALELVRLDGDWEKLGDAMEKVIAKEKWEALPALVNARTRISERRASLLGLDVTKYLPMIVPRDFDAESDLGRLSLEELHQVEVLQLKAQGRDPKPFGLAPEAEIFEEQDPAPDPTPEPPPGA